MKNQTLQYYMHDGPTAFQFELAGELNHEGAHRLDQDWRTASSVIGDRSLIVDMTFVTSVDERGRALLARWHRAGARLIASSKASRALAESIVGGPLSEPSEKMRAAGASTRTWLPFLSSFRAPAVSLLVLLAALVFPVEAAAATLRSETVAAWDDYLQTANADLQDRVRSGGSFLWTLEKEERAAKVRKGEIVVAAAPGQNPKRVPGGLIHHWMGAVFVPGVKIDDILEVTRDYDHYKEFYPPHVIESKAIARNGSDERFSMMLMNKVFLSKTALDVDCQATSVRVDNSRLYSVTRTTRVQEIEEYGHSGEHRIAEGEGSGYIWKLYSIARFEQRDGGVYVELEAIALSREIPAAVRLIADPIVRRVSRNSLLISLQQTGEAVHGIFVTAGVPATAEQLPGVPASRSIKSSAFTRVH
jgi:ABC-type transporter Mla MlaB component